MPTFAEWCRDTVIQVRADIAPGASGWTASTSSEGAELRSLVKAAQITILMDGEDALSKDVRNVVVDRIIHEGPGSSAPGQQWQSELDMTRGQMNSALIAAESYFDTEVAEGS